MPTNRENPPKHKTAKQSNQPNSADAKDLLSRFDIDPDKELSSADASNMANLFGVAFSNSIESRRYPIPAGKQELLDSTFALLKNGPLRKHIQFKEKWDDKHANIEITAPKLALDGFFDPLISLCSSNRRGRTNKE